MNPFEKAVLAVVAGGQVLVPVFVHTSQGMLILNASEQFLAGLLQIFAPPAPASTAPSSAVTIKAA